MSEFKCKVDMQYYAKSKPELVYEVSIIHGDGCMTIRWIASDGRPEMAVVTESSQVNYFEKGDWIIKYNPKTPCKKCRAAATGDE